jgi:hypothetical protein
MKQKLEEAPDKDLDVGVTAPNCTMVNTDTQMARALRVTDSYDRRNWLQRATIIFIYLHPKIGAKNAADTAAFTGMKESTLLGWMYQKRFVIGWLELVEAMDAGTALRALTANVQDMDVSYPFSLTRASATDDVQNSLDHFSTLVFSTSGGTNSNALVTNKNSCTRLSISGHFWW